jgi:MFS family permease
MISPARVAVLGLGVTQVIGYGTLYYAFAVLVQDMARDLGLSVVEAYACLSAAMFAGAFAGRHIGLASDRFGARKVMAVGSLAAALALAGLSAARGPAGFLAALLAVNLIGFTVFYNTAFTALTQIVGRDARRPITELTLIGGFASTLFWPLTQWLDGSLDWREIYLIYALAHALICAPIHWWLLAGARPVRSEAGTGADLASAPQAPVLHGPDRQRAFLMILIAFTAVGIGFGAMNIQMVVVFETMGMSAAAAVAIAAMMGPGQVTARLIEMRFGQGLHPLTTAILSSLALCAAFAILIAGVLVEGPGRGFAMAYVVIYGAAQGVNSIVLGTVPLALFGRIGYGAMVGSITVARASIAALAPFLFALGAAGIGMVATLAICLGLAALGVAAFVMTPRPAPSQALPSGDRGG